MQIKIAERLHPFSHQSGTWCLIPYTTWEVQIFPTRLYFRDLNSTKEFEQRFVFKGPVENFTLELDLEHGYIRVFGKTQGGYMEYTIAKNRLRFKKQPAEVTQEEIDLPIASHPLIESKERLSLGMHRSQDWEGVKRRADLREIFPVWLRLAALIPETKVTQIPDMGTLALLHRCGKAIEQKDKIAIVPLFTQVFQAAFQGIFAPRLIDEQFLGIAPEGKAVCSPLILLHEGARLIRTLFLKEEQILPLLPPAFHSGRLLTEEIAIEWSKKIIKKLIITSSVDQQSHFIFQKPIQSFRLRASLREHGKKFFKNDRIFLKAGQRVILDRFEK